MVFTISVRPMVGASSGTVMRKKDARLLCAVHPRGRVILPVDVLIAGQKQNGGERQHIQMP